MRKWAGVVAGILGIASILLTARYGYKQADEEVDRWIMAVMFGSISLCAFMFDALAVTLWFRGARRTGLFVGLIAALAFVVTFTNSLGGIASRADTVQAQRQSVTDSRADNRRELKRLETALARVGQYTPTDAEAVAAAKRAADAATASKIAECDGSRVAARSASSGSATRPRPQPSWRRSRRPRRRPTWRRATRRRSQPSKRS